MKNKQIQKGDIVGRKSYGKDVIFVVKNIFETKNGKIALLKGLVDRVEADSKVSDLELIDEHELRASLQKLMKE